MRWIKDFVTSHDGNQVLRFGQVDDVVSPTGYHVRRLNFVTRDFELHRLSGVDVPFLNKAVTGNHNEEFPLAVVPVLAFGNAGLGNVN